MQPAAPPPAPEPAAPAWAPAEPTPAPGREALKWGAVVAALTGLCYALSVGGLSPGAPPVRLALFGAGAAIVLLPFTTFAFYCAFRWVGLHPAPYLSGAAKGGLVPHAARMPLAALAVAIISVIGSGPLALLLLPDVETPEEHPFSGKTPLQLALGNLLVVVEETVFRLVLLFPLLALFGVRHAQREAGVRADWRVWAAIVLSGALFGLVHTPDAALLGAPLLQYGIFALVQKGLFIGTMLGWLCWRFGFEAAVLGHYLTNAIILVLTSFVPQ